ncbi:MAG: hypothetical protein ACE5KK_01120 [Candidatus Brocadiales bacterium]
MVKVKHYRCDYCGAEMPLLPVAFMCPECGLRHFFEVDRESCTNELLVPEIKCPRERFPKKKKRKGADPKGKRAT